VPIQVTANPLAVAYATVEQADAVAMLRVGGSRWLELSPEQKAQALTTATRRLDTLDWIGVRTDDDQLLDWPRTGTDFDDDAWPEDVVDATIELAFTYIPAFAAGSTLDVLNAAVGNGNIKSKQIGPLKTEYFGPTTGDTIDGLLGLPVFLRDLLRSLVRVEVTGGAWGTGVVVRGS
jgi:hypothetical protein